MTDERTTKHQRVFDYLDAHDLDAVLLSRRCNFSWYTCGAHNYVNHACEVGNSALLVAREKATVLTTNIEAPRLAGEELAGSGIEIVEYPYSDAGAQADALAAAVGSMRVATDAPTSLPELPALDAEFDRLRWTLTTWEIDRYRALCLDVVEAVEAAARGAERGQTEAALAGLLAAVLRQRDCMPWVLLVAADERLERFRHPLPTDRAVERVFMLVTCAERDGLIAACTRLASLGPVPDELARRHQAVVNVDAALISSTRPGATLGEIYAAGQAAYADEGFADEWRLHHQGGSCGYQPREWIASPGETTEALADQAFAWNPSITGTKSEDTILCTEAGPEGLAGGTDWPTVTGRWQGATLERPAILVR